MSYAVGALVRARGREWVVLPDSTLEMLLVRPLGGTFEEATGIHTRLENVQPATFDLPDPAQIGDYRSGRLLRDAVRLGFRSSAGPFRSFARIAVEPRPYQLVPLLMALKLDPVRLLIADDVGIGKTVEASLIAREMLDRGEIERLAVLCPPQLAEQWQAELASKFYIDAELVLPSTATRLERICRMGESLFERYPFVVVSMDFIKSDRRRTEFLRTCPEFVIVDEAHTCAPAADERGGRHQRHQLVSGLADDPSRHILLVTATPHSGKEQAFRSLLGILNAEFADLPDDLTGSENEAYRRELARYFVQRRRADIRAYMDTQTPFPERESSEATYTLTEDYRRLFNRVLDYARETVSDSAEGPRQRVKWWSALALLRSLASSPAAAAATLRARAATIDAETAEDVDEIGQRTVLDLLEDEAAEGIDVTPGGDTSEVSSDQERIRRRLQEMARTAEGLQGEGDAKLQKIVPIIQKMVRDGYHPIVFCRFIPTVKYLVEQLNGVMRGVSVEGITGELPPTEREARVRQLGEAEKRVLVCTDCLSEGINLQQGFNAVIHYDLSWNPTRHEQREGRVDRYGQQSTNVRTLIYYGTDNKIDGIVLDVLLRKHQTIRDSLGVSVPVPADTAQVVEAIFEGLLLKEDAHAGIQQVLPGFEAHIRPLKEDLFEAWEAAADREKLSRTMFAQRGIKVEEVAAELEAARTAVGSGVDTREFMIDAAQMHRGFVTSNGSVGFDLRETPVALREAVGLNNLIFKARFELPIGEDELYLTRTHPIVEGMATYVMDTALDSEAAEEVRARRCGAFRTSMVSKRTTLLLMRFRYHITTTTASGEERTMLAEDSQVIGFESAPGQHTWIDNAHAEELLMATPDANMQPGQSSEFVRQIIENFDALWDDLNEYAQSRAKELLEAHLRVRTASRGRGRTKVEPQTPPDVLGIYIYLPAGK